MKRQIKSVNESELSNLSLEQLEERLEMVMMAVDDHECSSFDCIQHSCGKSDALEEIAAR